MNDDIEELKKQTQIDNSKLEKVLEKEISPEMQAELIEALKESQLYLPVMFSPTMFEGIENAKEGDVFKTTGQEGFDINYLSDENGNRFVPLFTSSKIMKDTGLESSVMVMFTEDIVDMLKESDRYAAFVINPLTENEIMIQFDDFIGLFDESGEETFLNALDTILEILREKYIELEDDYSFFVRADEPFMKEDAVDGVFTPHIPFNISSREDFKSELEYLNILLLPKTTKIVFIGNMVDDDHWDTIIAPESEFEHVEDLDEYTTVWKCRAQPFYDEGD